MDSNLPNIDEFERQIFTQKKPLKQLLSFSVDLLNAKQAGLICGTNWTLENFLPPSQWDRGIIDLFAGKGWPGFLLRYFGKLYMKHKGLSPVHLYRSSNLGEPVENEGIIPFILRAYKDFYRHGIKVLMIDNIDIRKVSNDSKFINAPVVSYDGNRFLPLKDLKINRAIVHHFKAKNFVSAYIPDYGAIVFNTIGHELVKKNKGEFVHKNALKKRLDILISAIEMASLANIGSAKGQKAAGIIWRKEKNLRQAAIRLNEKQLELDAQKSYLQAVGAVNEKQLTMEALNVEDGVYAFLDMVESARIRKLFTPKDYFFIINICHQIAANAANRFNCRVDNFIGDSVFLQNISLFDTGQLSTPACSKERVMLMLLCVGTIINEIGELKKGNHPLDPQKRVKMMIQTTKVTVAFRAGIDRGTAMVGPLGSQKRKIVTAIGKAVNNASRLESSGMPEKIHISSKVMEMIKNSVVDEKTTHLNTIVSQCKAPALYVQTHPEAFLDFYTQFFNLEKPPVEKQENVRFKEYSKKKTYLLTCLPD